MAENGDDEATSSRPEGNGGGEASAEALARLRVVIDQATQAIREFGMMSEEWAGVAARDLRRQGERAVGSLSRQVEANPLAGLAVAFAIGYLCGVLTRR
jgi:ElaB/YqjD/DUF883 family membrane-anchored ribosome-binding protein